MIAYLHLVSFICLAGTIVVILYGRANDYNRSRKP
jgi:hypothetical protein